MRRKAQLVGDLGEDELVRRITANLPNAEQVLVGAGDDCAVVGRPRDKHWTLLKTDAVIEGIHFLPEEDYHRVGWKALCRNISDIAAMGGVPEHALVTVAIPPEMPLSKVDALYSGLAKAARKFGVAIVGGETSRSPGPAFVSVALTGSVERGRCVLRSGGRAGDSVYVTGKLGGSFASGKHLDFTPRLTEARWLVEHFRPTAMMDLSDGLGSDLPRLAKASGCGFEILPGVVPRSPGCSEEQALSDGEDFELLFTISAKRGPQLERTWKAKFPRLRLTRIGSLLPAESSQAASAIPHGFDHFSNSR